VLCVTLIAQSKPSIQGVWRIVEITTTNPDAGATGGYPKGTHTNVQPGVMIFTAKHYSQNLDIAGQPRPTIGFKVAGKPTAEEMQSQWGPFQAGAGTYELSGTTLTTRIIVAKNPAIQGKGFVRYSINLDGQHLWTTALENMEGTIEYPVTIKYVRVE
jgi:hypothetical protein